MSKQFYFKQFSLVYSSVLFDPMITPYHCRPKWTWEQSTPHSPKLQYHWSLTIRLFSAISWTLVGGVLPLCSENGRYILHPQPTGPVPFEY